MPTVQESFGENCVKEFWRRCPCRCSLFDLMAMVFMTPSVIVVSALSPGTASQVVVHPGCLLGYWYPAGCCQAMLPGGLGPSQEQVSQVAQSGKSLQFGCTIGPNQVSAVPHPMRPVSAVVRFMVMQHTPAKVNDLK